MTLTPRLQSTLRQLIEHGPATIAQIADATGFPRDSIRAGLYELRRMGFAGNGHGPHSGCEKGVTERAWTATDAGRTALAEAVPVAPPERKTPVSPSLVPTPGPSVPWTSDRLQSLFTERSSDVRDRRFYARERTLSELLKITGLLVGELETLLVRRNGFAEHGGRWTWNKVADGAGARRRATDERTGRMRCLSLWQPWATLIAIEAKRFETRDWSPGFIGLVAIHAAKKRTGALIDLCTKEPFRANLAAGGYSSFDDLPLGAVIAVADLNTWDETQDVRDRISAQEAAFGDYSDDRFAWRFSRVLKLPRPVATRGMQKIFGWFPEPDVQRLIDEWRAAV